MTKRASLIVTLAVLVGAGPVSGQAHEPDPGAARAFAELIQAYRQRDALTVRSTVDVQVRQDDADSDRKEVKATITFKPGRVGVVELNGYRCFLGGGTLQAVHEETDHSYFSMPDDGSPYYALLNVFLDIPFPHLAIAFGEDDAESVCMQLHPRAPWVQPTSVTTEKTDDGRTLQLIRLTSDLESIDLRVDPQRMLLESAEVSITGGPFVQPGAELVYRYKFGYETYEQVPLDVQELVFEPGQRQRADMLASLAPRQAPAAAPAAAGPGDLVGQEAPALLLATADGGALDLEDLRGKVVVLDFWATWCGPCRRALPMLHEVNAWAENEALPVHIVTVNTMERTPEGKTDPDSRLEAVRAFWTQNRFTLPVAMDYTDDVAAAYGVRGIPATFVIRSDGTVHAQHTGVSPEYAAQLKTDIRAALEALEQEPDTP